MTDDMNQPVAPASDDNSAPMGGDMPTETGEETSAPITPEPPAEAPAEPEAPAEGGEEPAM